MGARARRGGVRARFVGPITFNPGANQGPLLGLFITGPGGALFGLVAGVVVRMLPLTAGQRWSALGALCIASAANILLLCLPGPERRARIVDADVHGCESPAHAAEAATAAWRSASRNSPGVRRGTIGRTPSRACCRPIPAWHSTST